MKSSEFAQKAVVITGAASGIGRQLAMQLASRGAWLVLADIHAQELDAVRMDCRQLGGEALSIPADISQPENCAHLVEQGVAEYQRLDMLVNNAGITMWGDFEHLRDFDHFRQVMQVNFWGSVYCTYYALPHLKASRGRIVAVSSLAGKAGLPTRTAYSASKHALVGFFDALRMEVAPHGVSVTMVYPGFVATGLRIHSQSFVEEQEGRDPVDEARAMSAEECARRILRAAQKRKREEVMTARGILGQWLKLIAPAWVDRMALKAVQRGK